MTTQLMQAYGSQEVRQKLLTLRAFSMVLERSIIADSYKPSERLLSALSALSEEGKSARQDFARLRNRNKQSEEFNPSLANLYALLILVNREPLVNIETIQVEEIANAIADEIAAKHIKVPFVFGRELYDSFNSLVSSETYDLDHAKTIALLNSSDVGVVQVRKYVLGPLGCLKSRENRSILPSESPYLQHSADRSNGVPHRIKLRTSEQAAVNMHRAKYMSILKKTDPKVHNWPEYFRSIALTRLDDFNEASISSLVYLVGTALSDVELKTLLVALVAQLPSLDSIITSLAKSAKSDSTKYIEERIRPEIFQLLLTCSDEELNSALNNLVNQKKIVVPLGEIRRPLLEGVRAFGQWGTSMELGHWGTRVTAMFPGVPFTRFMSYLRIEWARFSPELRKHSSWRLTGKFEELSEEDLIEEVRSRNLEDVVSAILLQDGIVVRETMAHLKLSMPVEATDSEMISRILWGFGFDIQSVPHVDEYASELESVRSTLESSLLEHPDRRVDRRAFSVMLPMLESYLRKLVGYWAWLFLNDHYADEDQFTFNQQKAEDFAVGEFFDGNVEASRFTIGQFSSVVRRMSKKLRKLEGASDQHIRTTSELPRYSGQTALQIFPFNHRISFLDLTPASRSEIVAYLDRLADSFDRVRVASLRNDIIHYNDALPQVAMAHEVVKFLVDMNSELELNGLFPRTLRKSAEARDNWSRSQITFTSETGRSLHLDLPSPSMLSGLPLDEDKLLFVPIARLSDDGLMLRFRVQLSSEYVSYWSSFPCRPESEVLLDSRV